MTFLELKSTVRADLFVQGEGENLITAHNNFFSEALADLVDCVPCLALNLTNSFPSCATYFNCGMTVIPAPRGEIISVYTVGRGRCIDAASPDSWCKKVHYDQVEYCRIEQYVKVSQRCNTGIFATANAIANCLFGVFRSKRYYPAPDDAGLTSLPPLPPGFHYPQTSTDLKRRSDRGVWAIYRGRIYVAPWIESDETLVVEWNGKKITWNDTDEVDDDIKLTQAVKAFVGWKHYLYYEENPQKAKDFQEEYLSVRRDLIHNCREQTRIRECGEIGGSGSAARGMGGVDSLGSVSSPASSQFSNETQTYTASCPTGQTGDSVTVTIPAGTVGSNLSVADANATALAQATSQAQAQLVCTASSGTFSNSPQTYTANCAGASGSTPAATGSAVTVTIPAGQFVSSVSQAIADAAALAAAKQQAEAQLVCTFLNAPQTFTASCPAGSVGSNQTATVAAGQFTSAISQSDADAQALAEAQNQATAMLSCGSGVFTIGNTQQSVTRSGVFTAPGCPPKPYNFTLTVPPNKFQLPTTAAQQAATQLILNQQALAFANQQADQTIQQNTLAYQLSCSKAGGGGE